MNAAIPPEGAGHASVLSPNQAATAVVEDIWVAVSGGARTTIVNSPPGAGKSTLIRDISTRLVALGGRVPIVVQTNSQADDMVAAFIDANAARLSIGLPALKIARLHSSSYDVPPALRTAPHVEVSSSFHDLHAAEIVVSTAAKWARVSVSWPIAIIDEAYQMKSSDLLWVGAMAERLLAVGDPGQVDPFTTADTTQFRTMPLSPVSPAALTLIKTQPDALIFQLPVSWRLTPAASALVSNAFYQEPFEAGTQPGDRSMIWTNQMLPQPVRSVVSRVCADGWAHLVLPHEMTPENDPGVAMSLADVALGLLDAQIELTDSSTGSPRAGQLVAPRIAIGVAHNSQVTAVRKALRHLIGQRQVLGPQVVVETANKLQGRQFDVTLVWHPLSGRRDTSEFHLDAGRLCVLMSRHLYGCVVVSRDGILDQLLDSPSSDDHYPDTDGEIDGWMAQCRALEGLRPYAVKA